MISLARKLRTFDYFAFGFGTMVGVAWLVIMDDWLGRGGPWGAALGFIIGAAFLLPVCYIYGRMVMAMPDAGGEIAYTAKMFPPGVSFFAGWIMTLSYLIVCPWEGVAIGKIVAYLFPGLNTIELYRLGGKPVFLPHLVLGLACTAAIVYVNWRGVRISATLQSWMTAAMLFLFVVFTGSGLAKGSIHNTLPPFNHGSWISILLVLQIVPYYLTGFESIGKCAEEAGPRFDPRGFFRAMMAALLVAAAFYPIIILSVSYAYPWRQLIQQPFATAFALQNAVHSTWVVNLVLLAALFSLVKTFNGNFLAATRLLFALGRKEMAPSGLARIHPKNQTPTGAVWVTGALTAAGVCLGSAILVPITEVGSLSVGCGWLATCAAYFYIERGKRQRLLAITGGTIAVVVIAMKLLWFVPGHFTQAEWIAFVLWIAAGFAIRQKTVSAKTAKGTLPVEQPLLVKPGEIVIGSEMKKGGVHASARRTA